MATIKNLLVRIGVSSSGVEKGVLRTNRALDSVAKRVEILNGLGKAGTFAALGGAAIQLGRAFAPATIAIGHFAAVAAPAVGAIGTLPAALLSVASVVAVVKVGMIGMGDAMKAAAAGDAKKLQAALKGMSPAGKQFATVMAEIVKSFKPIQRAVQQKLFAGLGKDMQTLAIRNLPVLRVGMTGIAASLNAVGRSALRSANTPLFSGVMAKIMAMTASAIHATARPIGQMVTGLLRMLAISLPLLKVIERFGVGLLKSAGAWVASDRAAAKFQHTISGATAVLSRNSSAASAGHDAMVKLRAAWSDIRAVGRNLGSVLHGIGRAMQSSTKPTKTLGQMITDLTGRMAKWANSTQGQTQLRTLFTSLQQVASNLVEILPQLGGVLSIILGLINSMPTGVRNTVLQMVAWSVVLSKFTGPISGATSLVGKFFDKTSLLGKVSAGVVGGIGKAGRSMLGLGQAADGSGSKIGKAFKSGAATATGSLSTLGKAGKSGLSSAVTAAKSAGQAAMTAGTLIGRSMLSASRAAAKAAADVAVSAAKASAAAVGSFVKMAAQSAIAVARVVAGWVVMGVQSLINAAKVAASWIIAMGPVGWIIAAVVALVALIIANWRTVKRITVEVWNSIWKFISGIVSTVVDFVRNHWRLIVAIIGGPLGLAVALVTKYWSQILGAIRTAARGIVTAVEWMAGLPGKVAGWFYSMAKAVISYAGSILKSIGNIPGRIAGVFGNAGRLLYQAGRNIMVGLWNGVVSLWNWLISKFHAITDLIPRIKGPMAVDLKLLEPNGRAIMTGFMRGVTKSVPTLTKVMGQITQGIPGMVDPHMAFAGAGTRGVAAGAGSARSGAQSSHPDMIAHAIKSALHGTTVQMDGKPVGQIVSRHLGRDAAQRRKTG